MHASVTIAQLSAILIMTVLRSCAYIQRENRNDINDPDLVEGYELDWLAKDLKGCQRWEVIAKPENDNESSGESTGAALGVMKTRARLARLSNG
jgi:hypothetical protein